MTPDSVITMVVFLGGVWGGFIYLLLRTIRSGDGEDTPDQLVS
jgi:hypothetical protein